MDLNSYNRRLWQARAGSTHDKVLAPTLASAFELYPQATHQEVVALCRQSIVAALAFDYADIHQQAIDAYVARISRQI